VTGPAVADVLRRVLAERRAEIADIDARLLPQVDRIIGFVLGGGKRLRPQFLWWGWRAAGGPARGHRAEAALRAAASLELIQASALVHDDIIDNSETRRGEPSMHVDLGVSAAILLGDMALVWADDMFHAAAADLEAGAEAAGAWAGMRTEVMAGQLLDLHVSQYPDAEPLAQAEDARRVNRFKTAAYTVERPLHLGAALAQADPALISGLRRFGQQVGQAFQLRDDLLGVFGDAEITGKPAGDDLVEGKHTVLLAAARSAIIDPVLLAELDNGIGRAVANGGSPELTERLAAIIAESGAVQFIEAEIAQLMATALAELDGLPLPPDAAAALRDLAGAAAARIH
jgi:geranylgeranyl diphosphate synthase type I